MAAIESQEVSQEVPPRALINIPESRFVMYSSVDLYVRKGNTDELELLSMPHPSTVGDEPEVGTREEVGKTVQGENLKCGRIHFEVTLQ